MKKTNIILISIAILMSALLLYYQYLTTGQLPAEQPGTTWATVDGSVVFCVIEDETFGTVSSGYLSTGNMHIDVHFVMSVLDGGVDVYTKEDYSTLISDGVAYPIESWAAVSVDVDRFVVRVTNSTYFSKGQELILFKIDPQ